jgi:nonsense-mediated mRNA decay protein 3
LANVQDLVEFTILDIEPQYNTRKGKFLLADAQVAISSAFRSQSGKADEDISMDYDGAAGRSSIYHTRTHLGAILQPGDTALGYHLSHRNFNSDFFASLPQDRIPDVVLIKKSYPNRKKNKSRNWRLKSMAKEAEESGDGRGVVGRMGGRDQRKVEEDYELFLRDLEEDVEMRQTINLYKAKGAKGEGKKGGQYGMDVDGGTATAAPSAPDGGDGMEDVEDEEEGGGEKIGPTLDELLDDMHLTDGEEEAE